MNRFHHFWFRIVVRLGTLCQCMLWSASGSLKNTRKQLKCGVQHNNPAVVGRKSGLPNLPDDEYCIADLECTCPQDAWFATLCWINLKRIFIVQPEPGPLLQACTHDSKKH